MRYGVPYKGSKNQIAEGVVDNLPKAEYFVDLFCGGCAVTHRALISGKYQRFITNDIDGRMPKLFLDAVHGKYTVENHPEWVSREEFEARKAEDAYIATVWSFGNNGKDYVYGREVEAFKRELHRAIFDGNAEGLRTYGFDVKISGESPSERYRAIKPQIKAQKAERYQIELQNYEALDRLEALERLQSLEALERLQSLEADYQKVKLPEDALIYCDIPYRDTGCEGYGGGDFNHATFYEWARKQNNVFISEYEMPSDFVLIGQIDKQVTMSSCNNSQKATERLYTNEKTYSHMTDRQKRIIALNTAQQLTIMDFLGKEDV